jgi:hypothetical protein
LENLGRKIGDRKPALSFARRDGKLSGSSSDPHSPVVWQPWVNAQRAARYRRE